MKERLEFMRSVLRCLKGPLLLSISFISSSRTFSSQVSKDELLWVEGECGGKAFVVQVRGQALPHQNNINFGCQFRPLLVINHDLYSSSDYIVVS